MSSILDAIDDLINGSPEQTDSIPEYTISPEHIKDLQEVKDRVLSIYRGRNKVQTASLSIGKQKIYLSYKMLGGGIINALDTVTITGKFIDDRLGLVSAGSIIKLIALLDYDE